jgi:uncharacterized protein YfaS (alpha-2-macroglobulin family)
MHVYNLRTGKTEGSLRQLRVALDPYQPAIYALSPEPLPALDVAAPQQAMRGATVTVALRTPGTPADTHVVHIDVLGPDGQLRDEYSANVQVRHGTAAMEIPLAANDATGPWTIRATDILSGQTRTLRMRVE